MPNTSFISISPYHLAFPVFAALTLEDDLFESPSDPSGTCFLLGDGFFLTAAHVIEDTIENQREVAIGFPTPGRHEQLGLLKTIATERLPMDLGIIQVGLQTDLSEAQETPCFSWRASGSSQLDRVWTIGFPYGAQKLGTYNCLLQRAFSGYIVAGPIQYEPPHGNQVDTILAHELSFQAPPGLSGAPLLSGMGPNSVGAAVVGVVLGNGKVKSLISKQTFHEEESTLQRIVEHYEFMPFGLSLSAPSALDIYSNLLGCTLRSYLTGRGKLLP